MKNYITTVAILAAGTAFVNAEATETITLRYALTNFSNGSPGNTATNGGTTTVSRTGYVNHVTMEDISGTSKAVANLQGNGHFYISDDAGINAGGSDVLNTTDGFTLVFNGNTSRNWADFLSVNILGANDVVSQYKFETGNAYTSVYIPDGESVKEVGRITETSSDSKWYNHALSVLGNTYTYSIWGLMVL